jgi:hypothetical protein
LDTNSQRCQLGIVHRILSGRRAETTVIYDSGSEVAQTLPAGEQTVNFPGGDRGLSASASPHMAKKTNSITKQ